MIIDPKADYEPYARGIVTADFNRAVNFIVDRYDDDWHVVYRPVNDPEREGALLISLAESIQRHYESAPLALFIDEAWMYGSVGNLNPQLHRIYNLGRQWRINIVAAIQVDTDIHRVVRHNSHIVVTLRQHKLTTDFRNWYDLDAASQLETLTPLSGPPILGKHYLVFPEDVDVWDEWRNANTLDLAVESPSY